MIIDLSQVQFDVFIDNLGVSDAPTSTLAVRIVDSGTSSPIQADLQFPVPAIPAGAYHQMLVSGGGQISGGSLAAALTFTAIVDAAGVIAELDESNNTALSSSYPVVGAPPPGFTHGWLGGTSDWNAGSNWSTGSPPHGFG